MSNDKEGLGNNITIDNDLDISSTESSKYLVKNISVNDVRKNRKVLPTDIRNWSQNHNSIQRWQTDPNTLKDYSENLIVESLIDIIAKDVSSISWDLIDKNDEDTNENSKDEIKSFIKNSHPRFTFSDLIESTVRDLLIYGNAFWVLHTNNNNEPIELVTPNPATMFIKTDEMGYIDNYVQRLNNARSGVVVKKDNVVHFGWSSSTHRLYAKGAVEMCLDVIDIVDQILRKEMLDLAEGGESGIISQTDPHPSNPMSTKDWNNLVDEINRDNGRHHTIISKGSFNFTRFESNYSDMMLLDRYKNHIESISAAFKVSPSYAGFGFDSTNYSQDKSQRESYKQKGVKVVLKQLEDKINKDLLPRLGSNNLEFKWDIETDDSLKQVDYYDSFATAVKKLQEAGLQFTVEDDNIVVNDKEFTDVEIKKMMELSVLKNLGDNNLDYESLLNNEYNNDNEYNEYDYDNLTKRQKEFCDHMNSKNLKKAMKDLEDKYNRTDAIDYVNTKMGSFSPNTYYKWLDLCDLND